LAVVLGVSVIMLVAALITVSTKLSRQHQAVWRGLPGLFPSGPGVSWGNIPLEERQRKPLTLEDSQLDCRVPCGEKCHHLFADGVDAAAHRAHEVGEVSASIFAACKPISGRCMRTRRRFPGVSSAKGDDMHREKVVMLGENVAPVLFPGTMP